MYIRRDTSELTFIGSEKYTNVVIVPLLFVVKNSSCEISH
jgi:hypothetical protein